MTMFTPAHRRFNVLKFGMISANMSSFIEIGGMMTELSLEKTDFGLKSVRRGPWSPMHIESQWTQAWVNIYQHFKFHQN